MIIEIDSLDVPYHILSSQYEKNISGGEVENTNSDSNIGRFQYSPGILPFPFDDVSVRFNKFGDNYSVKIFFDSLDKKLFTGDTKNFERNIVEAKYKFIPQNFKSPKYQGHIFNEEKERIFALMSLNEGTAQGISIGSWGTKTYRFPESEDIFRRQVGALEKIANIFIKSLLVPYSDREEVRFYSDEVIPLNP